MKAVPEIDVSKLSPEEFWAANVATRKPLLIHGHPTDMTWRASSLWTDDYLIRRAGGAQVLVEVRSGPQEGYGRGVKHRMTFGEFVARIAAGETGLYLTAQKVDVASDGHPQLLAEPLLSLAGGRGTNSGSYMGPGKPSNCQAGSRGRSVGGIGHTSGDVCGEGPDFPASLDLAGHLIPQSINLWMGVAPEGSSSGLHHDFHDNLYVLLRGKKRFRLYPPTMASAMYTHGKIVRIYDNGRIVYKGQGDVLADGAEAADVANFRRRTGAETALAAAEAALARGEGDTKADLEALREEALEETLSAAFEGVSGDGLGAGADDFQDVDSDDLGSSDVEDINDGDVDKIQDVEEEGEKRRKALHMGGSRACGRYPRGKSRKGRKRSCVLGAEAGGKGAGVGYGKDLIVDPETPPSFSRVPLGDPRVSDAQLMAEFPLFPGRAAALEVTVEAGDMLYLPSGWFHEVTSYGCSGGRDGGHLACNYWFHPPNNLDPSRRGFRAPYTSDFWPALWRARVAECLLGGLEPGLGAQPAPGAGAAAAAVHQEELPGQKRRGRAAAGQKATLNGNMGGGDTVNKKEEHATRVTTALPPSALPSSHRHDNKRLRLRADEDDGGSSADGQVDGEFMGNQKRRELSTRAGIAAAVKALNARMRAAMSGGEDGSRPTLTLTDEEYKLWMVMDAARQRRAMIAALEAHIEKQMKREKVRRLRAALPKGRRHHAVISVGPEVRSWRPTLPQQQQQQQQLGKQQQNQHEEETKPLRIKKMKTKARLEQQQQDEQQDERKLQRGAAGRKRHRKQMRL